MEIHTIGIDLGKTVFHLVGLNVREVVMRSGGVTDFNSGSWQVAIWHQQDQSHEK